MKSVVRLGPGKPEVTLYWAEPDGTSDQRTMVRPGKHGRKAWTRLEAGAAEDGKKSRFATEGEDHAL